MKIAQDLLSIFFPVYFLPNHFSNKAAVAKNLTANIHWLKVSEVTLHHLSVHNDGLAIKQNPQHAARQSAISGDVVPLVSSGTVDKDIALAHHLLLSRVENQLEHALDNDTVVD